MSGGPPSGSGPRSKGIFNFPKIELHVHLPGCVRYSTLLELNKKIRTNKIKNMKTEDDLRYLLVTRDPNDPAKVQQSFETFLPLIQGNADAIERIAYEMCEDQSAHGVVYFEARYSPHQLCKPRGRLKPPGVVLAVKKGFDRGEEDFNIKARSILSCVKGELQEAKDVLRMACDLKHLDVVGIDLKETMPVQTPGQYDEDIVKIFQEAFEKGINRTVQAGPSTGPRELYKAITKMHAQRLGGGYKIMNDPSLYEDFCVDNHAVHMEACATSSIMTGEVQVEYMRHPIAKWNREGVSFSVSRDYPTCYDITMLSELELIHKKMGLTPHDLWKCQVNAVQACFLPDAEKSDLYKFILSGEPREIVL